MLQSFVGGCIRLMVNDFWSRFLFNFVGKPMLIGLITSLIVGVIIGLIALIVLPIGGTAAALGFIFSHGSMELIGSALAPLAAGILFLSLYVAAWACTLAVMITGVTLICAGMAIYELGSAIVKLGNFLFGNKTPATPPLEDVRLGVHLGSTQVELPAPSAPPRLPPHSSVQNRQTSAFFTPETPTVPPAVTATTGPVAPIDYPPTVSEFDKPRI